ncbi:hypothetical protein ATANTOWER_025884 [Ataeniobius toweri]|uniref:Uncharacterized protein n=1 Tax=Ataeniobius toweri TaxID=208326 RepID=A0ABU7B8P9_9TELE|nr:hypothetical protein [Ataeniobius toweri]
MLNLIWEAQQAVVSFRFKLRQAATGSLDGLPTWEMLALLEKKAAIAIEGKDFDVHVGLMRLSGETFFVRVTKNVLAVWGDVRKFVEVKKLDKESSDFGLS